MKFVIVIGRLYTSSECRNSGFDSFINCMELTEDFTPEALAEELRTQTGLLGESWMICIPDMSSYEEVIDAVKLSIELIKKCLGSELRATTTSSPYSFYKDGLSITQSNIEPTIYEFIKTMANRYCGVRIIDSRKKEAPLLQEIANNLSVLSDDQFNELVQLGGSAIKAKIANYVVDKLLLR